MHEIHVNAYIHAPIEQVFERVSDHVRFLSDERTRVRIARPGSTEENGLGCLREVRAGPIRLVEEITAFDRPHRYDYRIIESTLPLAHEGGWLALTTRGEGTEINWHSRYTVPLPLAGDAAARLLRPQLVDTFTTMLMTVKDELEAA